MTDHVFLVDDHPVVRSGLVALLGGQPSVEVVGEAASGQEALAAIEALPAERRPDVVLCDLRLGEGMDGVSVTRSLRALADGPAVVILTTYDHDTDIVRAVEAGAAGYLLKDAEPSAIVEAIAGAARGETVLSPQLTQRVVETMRAPQVTLSDREREVLQLVAEGLSNRAIAKRLLLSEATVKTHLNRAFTKLGADSRTGAVSLARRSRLID
jgi:DNA-binding NarL/FixJ family response regulator